MNVNVGSFVTLKIAGINGPFKVAGIVKRILPIGVEVKTQANGYHVVPVESVTVVR